MTRENASRTINVKFSVSEMFPEGFLFLFLFHAFGKASGLKTWIPRTNVDEISNWNGLELPKNCDQVSFSVSDDLTVSWPIRDLLVTGLRLPPGGTVAFVGDVSIRFADGSRCPHGRVMEYVRDVWKGWLDPANWKSEREEMWLPHAERIPCFGEDVKFPPGNNFAVTLPPIKLPIGKIYYDNEELDGDDWADFLNTKPGRSQFRSEETSQAPWLHTACPTRRKCTCGESPYVFKNRIYDTLSTSLLHQAVCLYAEPSCGSPGCFSPVKPEGHCCGVCGAVFRIRDDSQDDRVLEEVEGAVKGLKTDWNENVGYHVGRTMDGSIEISVLTEKSGDMSDALAAAASVKDYLAERNFDVTSSKFSGLTLSGYFFNSASGIAFGTLCAVALFYLSLYVIYVVLPEKNFHSFIKMREEGPFRFARFKNVLHESGSEEKLEIGTEALVRESSRGFHNPTFSGNSDGPSPKAEGKTDEGETETGRDYENPVYHEMENAREFIDGEPIERDVLDGVDEFKEIEL